jgi:hypothetical protein
VTYQDGSLIPADQIHLVFVSLAPPIDPKTPLKNDIADIDGKTGAFDFISTYGYRDSNVSGEHKVVVHCLRNGRRLPNLLPPEFANLAKTPLRVRSGDSPFNLALPKPRLVARTAIR